LKMASAYSIWANGGFRVEPHLIKQVRSLDGEILSTAHYPQVCDPCDDVSLSAGDNAEPATLEDLLGAETDGDSAVGSRPDEGQNLLIPAERVVDERVSFIINTMLRDVIQRGTGIRARRAFTRKDLAGKTGTTNEADTWFNGFQRTLATTVWVGFSDHRPLGDREYGSNTPLPIWIDFMQVAMAGVPEYHLVQPEGVVSLKIDPETGERAAPGQRNAIFEYFLSDHLPPAKQETIQLPDASENKVRAEDIF